jgi:hypothetical protein
MAAKAAAKRATALPPVPVKAKRSVASSAPSASELASGVAGATGASVPGGAINPSSAYENYPANDLTPSQQPAAWGITNPSLQMYVGSKSQELPTSSPLRQNRLMGDIADRIGVKAEPVDQMPAQYLPTSLALYFGVPVGKDEKSDVVLRAVADKLGVPKTVKGNTLWTSVADKLGIDVTGSSKIVQNPQTMSIVNVAASIYNMSGSQLEALQTQLYDAGYYDQNVYTTGTVASKVTPGNLDPYTMKAWGTFLQSVASSGKNTTWSDVLNTEATTAAKQQGTTGQGIATLLAGSTPVTSSTPSVQQATAGQLLDPLRSMFEQMLGRLPTDAELQQFVTQYDAAQQANSKYIDPNTIVFPDSDTGIAEVPGVPRATYAAEAMAQSDNTEYQAHQITNAGALMLNAMRGGSGLGTEPNVTNAG